MKALFAKSGGYLGLTKRKDIQIWGVEMMLDNLIIAGILAFLIAMLVSMWMENRDKNKIGKWDEL